MWMILLLMTLLMPAVNEMKLKLSNSFYPLLENKDRYLILAGGAGSGKSEFAARKILYRCMKEGNHKFLVLRKVRSTVWESVMAVHKTLLESNNIPYEFLTYRRTISFKNSNGKDNYILFDGMDDPEKIKSIKGITGVHIEEATEFTKDDFIQLDLRLREKTENYKQIILSFNPDEEAAEWIKNMFFEGDKIHTGKGKKDGSFIHHSTVADNPIKEVRDEYHRVLDDLDDHVYFTIYRLGQWAVPKGKIYSWDVVDLPKHKESWYDEIFYGGDFGYSIDPAALIKIYRKANEFWVEEHIYETDLTNIALGHKIKSLHNVDIEDPFYWDAAEPKSIQELCDMGINAIPCVKGPDSVRAGIDFLKEQKIHIVRGSTNIEREMKKYKWKVDKDGRSTGKPVEFLNHTMDAIRYGIYTHCKEHIETFLNL